MLVMIDYCICTCIDKETISILHSWTWKLIMFMSTMHND